MNETIKIEVAGDDNCYIRAISLIIYKTENQYLTVRKEIVNYITLHKQDFEHL